MEIHSSSLASIHIGHRAKNRNENTSLSNNSKTQDNIQIQKSLNLPSPKTKAGHIKETDLKQISDELEKQKNTTTNAQNTRALNAYIEENIQPLKNQRSGLISGIDLFA